jgi:hypothetical protein
MGIINSRKLSIQALLKLYGKDAGFGEQKEEANGTSS